MKRFFAFAIGCAVLSAQTKQSACEDCARMIDTRSLSAVSTRSLEHKPSNAARKEFDRGMKAWRRDRNDQALEQFALAVGLDPEYWEAILNLGVAYASAGDPSRALGLFEQGLALEPNLYVLHVNKAGALILLGRLEEAEQAARNALKLAPDSTDANFHLGMALIMRGEVTPEAIACLKFAAPKDARARKALASVEGYVRPEGGR